MLIHVDLNTRAASLPNDDVLKRMSMVYEAPQRTAKTRWA